MADQDQNQNRQFSGHAYYCNNFPCPHRFCGARSHKLNVKAAALCAMLLSPPCCQPSPYSLREECKRLRNKNVCVGVTNDSLLRRLPGDYTKENNQKLHNRMLCPEVWNFKAPESNFSSKKLAPNESNHLNVVHSLIYNHLVSVVLPDTFKVPESLSEALSNDCDYYKISNVKLSEFVAKDFINNFVNSGSLYILSADSRIDCDNCTAVTPSGQLILSLNKARYQSLGLEGNVSHFHKRSQEKYTVTVDLKQKHFKPGKPNYERTRNCLENIHEDVILTWEPPIQDICPSSIARYFYDLGYKIEKCEIKKRSHTIYSIKVPKITNDNHAEVVEWLGMVALEGNVTGGTPDDYVTTYETPKPNQVIGQVKFLQWRGLFTTNQMSRLCDRLSEFKASSGCPWVAFYVQGFSDSPIAWRAQEHHYYTNGDNSYVFIFTDDHVISYVQKCSRKRYNNKRKGKPL